MITASNIAHPLTVAAATMAKRTPEWFDSIDCAIECMSPQEAKDLIVVLAPDVMVVYQRRNSVFARSNNAIFEITAMNMKHIWSEDHCTDKIAVRVFIGAERTQTVEFVLSDTYGVEQIISGVKALLD